MANSRHPACVPTWRPPPPSRLAGIPGIAVNALIGRGGMGAVYSARLLKDDRPVALKVARLHDGKAHTYLSLLVHEAQVMAHLDHASIVKVYDFGLTDGLAWVIMEFVDGPTLRTMLSSRQISLALALSLSRQLCDGLAHAHARGVIHHDLKPENILVCDLRQAKIIDFGLSQVAGFSYTISRPGRVSGTLRYMAPEQMSTPGSIDHRIDIFALGMIMYEMVTGHLPQGTYRPPSYFIKGTECFDTLIARCIQHDPKERWPSATDLGLALRGIDWEELPQREGSTSTQISANVSSIFISRTPSTLLQRPSQPYHDTRAY